MAAFLSDTLCKNCHSAGLELQAESTAVCRYCGTVNTVAGSICPHCEFINVAGAQICEACHQSLTRKCPNCNTLNWAGAEQCMRCQNPLDVVASLGARYATDTAGRLRAQQRDAASMRAKEAFEADKRTAELNAIEERRQQHLHQAINARDGQQRLWTAALIVLGFIVIVGAIIGLALLTAH
jgi:hypothetical protein